MTGVGVRKTLIGWCLISTFPITKDQNFLALKINIVKRYRGMNRPAQTNRQTNQKHYLFANAHIKLYL